MIGGEPSTSPPEPRFSRRAWVITILALLVTATIATLFVAGQRDLEFRQRLREHYSAGTSLEPTVLPTQEGLKGDSLNDQQRLTRIARNRRQLSSIIQQVREKLGLKSDSDPERERIAAILSLRFQDDQSAAAATLANLLSDPAVAYFAGWQLRNFEHDYGDQILEGLASENEKIHYGCLQAAI